MYTPNIPAGHQKILSVHTLNITLRGIWYLNQDDIGIHSPEWAALAEVCIEVDNEKSEEGWDNAYLMAASIELYDACRAFVKAMKTDGNKGLNKAYQLAQEAIAKAKSRGNII